MQLAAVNAKLNVDGACTAAAAVPPLPGEVATVAAELGEANRTIMYAPTRQGSLGVAATLRHARDIGR